LAKNIFWDLDGTLTDSSEGITKCVKLALDHYTDNDYTLEDLRCFIGPPLRDTFPRFGVPEGQEEEATAIFRTRYNTIGKFENRPYDGITDLLRRLKDEGFKSYVATSKPEITSKEILEKFEMTDYFELICGATMDKSRDSKEDVIRYLLEQAGSVEDVIMIGDTHYDVIGARAHGIRTIGVEWGFGDCQEMLDAGAVAIAHDIEELYRMILLY